MTIRPRICPERCVIFTESMKKSEGKPIALRRSQAFYDVLDQMSVYVNAGELIVGNQAQWPKSSPIYPEYSTEWLRSELVEGKPYFPNMRPGDRFDVAPEDVDAIMKCVDYWEGKSLYEALRRPLPQEINEAWDANVIDDTWAPARASGNEVVDYNLVVTKGLRTSWTAFAPAWRSWTPRSPAISARSGSCEAASAGQRSRCQFFQPHRCRMRPPGGGLPGRQA